MPAGVPGIPVASAREDRLHPKGRLRQQPADDSAEEGWSQAMETKVLQRPSRQKWNGPDKSDRGADRSDERHDHDQPMRGRGSFPTAGSEAKERGYALQMPVQGEDTL
jgi:hypothetical protein